MAHVLGIDVGTTKIAAVVLDAATGHLAAIETQGNESRLPAAPGRSEWDADRAVEISLAVARAAGHAAGSPPIAAVGVTGQMHGMLLVDEHGHPRTPFIGWQDQRCTTPLGTASSAIAWLRELAGEAARSRTGCTLAPGFMGATLFWLIHAGQLPAEPVRATFLPDYLVARLCDQPPVSDPTQAASAGLFNLAQRRWDDDLLAALMLPVTMLPPVRPTGVVAGHLSARAAAALDLPAGLPVLNALGDNQASFVGSVAQPDQDLLINIGTGGQLSATTASPAASGALEARPFIDERYLLVGAGLAGGAAYAVLHDFFQRVGTDLFGVNVAPDGLYATLNQLAAAAPASSAGLECDPYFTGTRVDPERRGSFRHLSPANFTPGHLARSLLEGLAASFHGLYEQMLAAGLRPRQRLIGAGNGLRRNPLLARIVAERFGLPLVTPRHTEEAAYGAALLASVAIGAQRLTTIGDLIQYQEI